MFYDKKNGDCEIWFGDCEITSIAKMATVNFRICRALYLHVIFKLFVPQSGRIGFSVHSVLPQLTPAAHKHLEQLEDTLAQVLLYGCM